MNYPKLFTEKLNTLKYKQDYQVLFADFVLLLRYSLQVDNVAEKQKAVIAKYDSKDLEVINDLFQIYFQGHNYGIEKYGWYDLLGLIYEELVSSYKASGLGQFFTPDSISNLLATMNSPTYEKAQKPITVSDVACGSGRLLLAYQYNLINLNEGNAPNAYYHVTDLDQVAANMCTINFALHGLRGTVVNGNSLTLEMKAQYEVNYYPNTFQGLPHIKEVQRGSTNHIDFWKMQNNVSEIDTPKPVQTQIKPGTQLTLW